MGGDAKGLQGVFNNVADALASELVQNGLGNVLEQEGSPATRELHPPCVAD